MGERSGCVTDRILTTREVAALTGCVLSREGTRRELARTRSRLPSAHPRARHVLSAAACPLPGCKYRYPVRPRMSHLVLAALDEPNALAPLLQEHTAELRRDRSPDRQERGGCVPGRGSTAPRRRPRARRRFGAPSRRLVDSAASSRTSCSRTRMPASIIEAIIRSPRGERMEGL